MSGTTIEEEVSESLMNSKALCLSEDQAPYDDGMILKDLSRSYHESELGQSNHFGASLSYMQEE